MGFFLENPLNCLGKIVRRQAKNGKIDFGISICQIDTHDLEKWERCVSYLAEHGAIKVNDDHFYKKAAVA